MARIFISYARDDGSELADEFADELRKHHYVFRDQDNIPGGAKWETVLNSEVKNANVIVLLVTPASLRSNWIFKEFDAANKKGKLIIPVRVDDTPLLPYLGDRQAIQLRDGNIRSAAADINMAISQLGGGGRSTRSRLLLPFVLIVVILAAGVFLIARGSTNNTPSGNVDGLNNSFVSTSTEFIPTITLAPSETPQPSNSPLPTKTTTPTSTFTNTPIPPTTTPTSPPVPLLFGENFDNNSLSQGIKASGQWVFVQDGANVVYQLLDNSQSGQLKFGDENWQNYALEFDIRVTNLTAFTSNDDRVFARVRVLDDDLRQITLAVDFKNESILLYKNEGEFYSATTQIGSSPIALIIGDYKWLKIRIEIKDQTMRVALDGLPRINVDIGTKITNGAIQIQSPNAFVQFDNIKVLPIN
ncbi:MAG: TIR domain-containing protein [Chloroflexota bacterium]